MKSHLLGLFLGKLFNECKAKSGKLGTTGSILALALFVSAGVGMVPQITLAKSAASTAESMNLNKKSRAMVVLRDRQEFLSLSKAYRQILTANESNLFESLGGKQLSGANEMKTQVTLKDLASRGLQYGLKNRNLFSNTSAKVETSLNQLNTFVLTETDDSELAALAQSPGVALVEKEVIHPLPELVRRGFFKRLQDDSAAEAVRALGKPWGIDAIHAREAWAKSNAGAGVRVMVLDTGIDRDHPSLATAFEQGKDFVGDANGPYEYADSMGHGSHVSGTIAGFHDLTSGFTGVAPAAKILAGRVCGAKGCSNIAIASGIDWAVAEKVSVINMSLGGAWSTPAERNAIEKAEEAGVSVVAASGNDGTNRVGYPAALPTVIAVGAVDSTLKKAEFSQYGPELDIVAPGVAVLSAVPQSSGRESKVEIAVGGEAFQEVKSTSFSGAKEVTTAIENNLVFAKLGTAEDFQAVNVKDKFALVQRGEIKFADKAKNALASGAKGLVIFNNVEGLIQGSVTDDGSTLDIGIAMIEQTHGERLRDALDRGESATARLQTMMTDYASWDGTSMATPHVAGVVALVRAANPSLTPAEIRELIKVTAAQPAFPNTLNEYGAGIVDAKAIVDAAQVGVIASRLKQAAGF